jgi:hypothetical protein
MQTNPNFNTVIGRITTPILDPLIPLKIELDNLPRYSIFLRLTDAARTVEEGSFRTLEPLGSQTGLRFGATERLRENLHPIPRLPMSLPVI